MTCRCDVNSLPVPYRLKLRCLSLDFVPVGIEASPWYCTVRANARAAAGTPARAPLVLTVCSKLNRARTMALDVAIEVMPDPRRSSLGSRVEVPQREFRNYTIGLASA